MWYLLMQTPRNQNIKYFQNVFIENFHEQVMTFQCWPLQEKNVVPQCIHNHKNIVILTEKIIQSIDQIYYI